MSNYRRKPFWYKDAIIYELNIKGFYDSDGDGIGDFAGLEQKLDYLEDLGVTAIWLLPFYPSPLRDDGYDIADYYTVSSAYGNIDDFKRFLAAAHERNLQVITELVINHTSDQHPWFQRARRAPVGSKERDYYVWNDTDDKYPDVRIIFTDTETSNWTWDSVANQYYWHRFFSHQPDLNYDSPDVQAEIVKILDYWMSMGIDGFRLDAIPYLFEREGTNGENLPETHAYLKTLRKHVDENYDNVLFLAEANMWPEDSAAYFGDGDECHMNYHFPLMPRMYMSVKMEDRHPITDIFDQTPAIPPNCQWATFLRNHDELTLEMVTDEERDFMYQVYAKDKTARINVGIRRRLAPLMDNDRAKIELMNMLLLSLPGTPVLYYGDEIGMGDNFYLGDRDGVRTPMQWNNNENGGFSEANPHSLYLPVIRDSEYSYRWVNVRRQLQTPNSLLNWTKRVLAKRKEHQVFGRGDIRFLTPENGRILAFVRSFEEESILVIINLSRYPQSVNLDLSDYQGQRVREVFGRNLFGEVGRDPYHLTVAAYGYYWLRLEQVPTDVVDHRILNETLLSAPAVADLFNRKNVRALEDRLLPAYLTSVAWAGPRADQLEKVTIAHRAMLTDGQRNFAWLLLDVTYKEGLPEMIQLPLAFHYTFEDEDLSQREEVVGRLDLGNVERPLVLIDALYDEDYRADILNGLADLAPPAAFKRLTQENLNLAENHVLALDYNGEEYYQLSSRDYNVKYHRRVDTNDLPDLETKNLLSSKDFGHSSSLAGSLHFQPGKQLNATLATFERRNPSEGGAWEYVLNNFNRFAEELMSRAASDPKSVENPPQDRTGLTDHVVYKKMPEIIQELLGSTFVVRIANLGRMVAAFHEAVAGAEVAGFETEALSLHYQRSVFAGLKGRVRETMQLLRDRREQLNDSTKLLAGRTLDAENELLEQLKRIFDHKIESDKIRIHGDLTLEQIAVKGEDFIFLNFDGDPDQPFSQRRLRRSPVKDIANLLRSFHYASGLALEQQSAGLRAEQREFLQGWLDETYRCLAAEFITAYRKATNGRRLLPEDEHDLRTLLRTFMIEKALQEVRYDLRHRPEQVSVGLRGLLGLV